MTFKWIAAPLAFVSVLAFARAAEPQSDDARWDDAVHTLASVLNGTAEHEKLDKILSDHSWVAPFARNRTESVGVLPDRLAGMTVISVRSSMQPSVTSATDLVADVLAAPGIAESVRKRIVPPEGKDLHQADATMARWFATALDAQPGDPVALIALYDPGQPTAVNPASPTLVLLLVRGEVTATGPQISRVLYGSIESAVR